MKKNKRRSRGAVSVFLTLVLIPCIIVTCAFDDISRVQLSKAGAASAADLALYSLMAEYDVDLKDYYGLVASSQDIDEFYEKTATYFCGMMDAKGVSGEGSELFTEYLKSLQNGEVKVSDFLQVEMAEPVKVSAADHAQMGENPALIEDGIVEFMKYRGPVTLVTKVIDRFTKLNLGKNTADVDKDRKIVEKKQEYAQAEGDLLSAALYSYVAIYQYETAWSAGNPLSVKGYEGISSDLSSIWNDLKKATELTVKYYFSDTANMGKVDFPVYNHIDAVQSSIEEVGTAVVQEDGSIIYCINTAMLQELTEGLEEESNAVENARNTVQNSFPQFSDGMNPAVYMLEVQEQFSGRSELRTISENMKKLLKRYADMMAAMQCVPFPEGDDLPQQWQEYLNNACTAIRKIQKSFSDADNGAYMQHVREYRSCVTSHFDKIKKKGYTFPSSYTGSNETFGSFLSQVASRLPELRSEMQELVDKLSIAIDGGEVEINGRTEMAVSLDELVVKARTYQYSRQQWGAAAERYDTEFAEEERDAYHGTADRDLTEEERKSEEMAAQISSDAVSELKQRLQNISSGIQGIINALDGFTYGGCKVDEIYTADTLVSLGQSVMSARSGRLLSQNEADAASYFSSLIHPNTDTIFQPPVIDYGVTGNHPDIAISSPGLYAYFKTKFKEDDIRDIEANKKENDANNKRYQEEAESKKESSQKIENDILHGKGGDISGGHGGSEVTVGTAISSIAGIAGNILNGSGDELRDQLYVCEYIMDMFSYSTFDTEGKYKRAVKKKTIKPSEVPLKDEEWDTDDKKNIPANQSLTNRAINQKNNKANLGEVEYILYGRASIDENLNTAYKNIFTMREAMNLVSGFVNFYSGSKNDTARAIHSIAVGVSAATSGVVPVSVTKCVLIGVLATLETAHDLYLLKRGFPVEFYKTSDKDWAYAFHKNEGSGFPPTGNRNKPGKQDGMYYSDYMYLFLMIGLTSDQHYPDMLLRIGDLIEANMQQSGHENFDLGKSICYFRLNAKVRVKPLMLTLPVVRSMEGVDPSSLLESKDWCTYDVNIYRGYS